MQVSGTGPFLPQAIQKEIKRLEQQEQKIFKNVMKGNQEVAQQNLGILKVECKALKKLIGDDPRLMALEKRLEVILQKKPEHTTIGQKLQNVQNSAKIRKK